ncbi:hypothetical protein [Bradyrhizobium sp.]|uniref:hypothetical protein n=1 Tax=Bradyrhizobium sp. TaxID=376 RepID=UPI003C3C2671
MTSTPRYLLILPVLFGGALCAALSATQPARVVERAALTHGTAIVDPAALRELDGGRFSLARMLAQGTSADKSNDAPLADRELFALPSMLAVRKALEADFDRYVEKHEATVPNESIGVGSAFDFQLFDRALLDASDARFVLSGIVNRMDRAYVSEKNCGEIRLIYRMTRTGAAKIGELDVSPRLPMTLNIVLKAKGDDSDHAGGGAITCAEIARRWLAAGELTSTGAELAEKLTAKGGALDLIAPENIYRMETNLQIAHVPKSATHEFRTDYLMKVFDYDASSATFQEAVLENQIDRDRLLADENLRREFKTWLLDPSHFNELDRGTLLIPDQFLAKSAIAPTPIGFSASEMQPAFGLVQGEDQTDNPVFSESDVVTALQNATEHGVDLQNIHSAAGFERRLNDITCGGCHQTRGIGGFHFPGVDWMAAKPDNSVVVPASPHFFGDQVRRRDIITAFADGKMPDFSRGFASRPQSRGSSELAGTEYEDGWGAHCYAPSEHPAETDKSFASWTCAEGLSCQVMSRTSRMGMCFIKTRPD